MKQNFPKKYLLYLEYFILTILITWPFFKPGYIFAVDMAWPTNLPAPTELNNTFLRDYFLHFLNFIIPSQIIQKLIIFSTVFLAGLSAHKLYPSKSEWPKYFAGLLYLFTPFFFTRMLYGHLYHLLAYAILPFLAKAIFNFIKKQTWKNAGLILMYLFLITNFSLHFGFIAILFFLICILTTAIYNLFTKSNIKQILYKSCLIIIILCVLCSYWLIPFIRGDISNSDRINSFTNQDREAFLTDNGETNIFFNVASMYGFWADQSNLYILPKKINPIWWLFSIIILSIVISGIVLGFKNGNKRLNTIILTTTAVIALILSIGIAFKLFILLIDFLEKYIPFYKGMREPQKFVGLLVLCYAYLGAQGIDIIYNKYLKNNFKWLAIIPILIVILYNPLLLNGFNGQLFATKYPDSWHSANHYFNQDNDNFQILFLPWHQYMSYDFVKNKIVAPIPCRFFDKPSICGDNMEAGEIYSSSQKPFSIAFESLLNNKASVTNLAQELKKWNIKYIVLLKQVDWQNYVFVQDQNNIELIENNSDLMIFKINTN